jgi:hypothetical protein
MADKRPFFPPRSRVLVGAMIAIISGVLCYLQVAQVREQLATLRWVEANRAQGQQADSALYASALYHASFAQGTYAGRWGLTGYMTLGVFGVAAGAAVALSALWRRASPSPPAPTT